MIRVNTVIEHSGESTRNGGSATHQETHINYRSTDQEITRASLPTTEQRLQQAQTEWRTMFSSQTDTQAPKANREIAITEENMRVNNVWGDELKEKMENTLRVYAGNINGFSLDRRGGQYDSFCQMIKEVQADIICGQEHNLNTTNSAVRGILNNTTTQHWKRNRINFASTPIAFEKYYKPGGTFIMSVGDTTSRLRDRYQDNWGRWTSQTFQGRAGRLVTVISAYQVVTDTPAKGTTTAAAQQHSLLLQTNDVTTSPRVAFRRDLKHFIKACRDASHEILLVGDFNESVGNDPEGMSKFLVECELVNIMTRRHSKPLPSTYSRGRRCLDYAFATEQVANAVTNAGYEPFNIRYPTDHRTYFIDLATSELFGIQLQPLAKHEP